ncbi:MAG: hypothetical protein LBU66_05100 [Treponema sp.]|jgi:hypothetical protein|nr:hypothetical protein [Treponema sp.]
MRIESGLPNYYINMPQPAQRTPASTDMQNISYYSPGVIVDISQQARDAYNQSRTQAPDRVQGVTGAEEIQGCQTCKSRRYVDDSGDSSVSYQTPTHISPEESASKVMAHEREHVANEQAKADQNGRRVISQNVSLSTSLCSECGKIYVSGGVTRTVTADKKETQTENQNNTGETNAEL